MESGFLFYIHHNSKIKINKKINKILTNLFKGNNNNNNLSNWHKQIYILKNLTYQKYIKSTLRK